MEILLVFCEPEEFEHERYSPTCVAAVVRRRCKGTQGSSCFKPCSIDFTPKEML